jgi:hypothetical protein
MLNFGEETIQNTIKIPAVHDEALNWWRRTGAAADGSRHLRLLLTSDDYSTDR